MIVYDLREIVRDIQRPYWPWHPDYQGEEAELRKRVRLWTPNEALRQLRECPSDKWRDAVLYRLRRIGDSVPSYVHHPLVDYLIEQGALTREPEREQ